MDNIEEKYIEKLTPSANEALQQVMEEVKQKILEKAVNIAQKRSTADKEISLRDILEAMDSFLDEKKLKETQEYKKKRLSLLILAVGIFYSIAGILIYVIQNNNHFFESDNWGLIIALIGIVSVLLGFVYGIYNKSRIIFDKSPNEKLIDTIDESDFEIIKRWKIIEKLGAELMKEKGYSEKETKSFINLMSFLSDELKNDMKVKQLREILSVRNKILHESYQLNRSENQRLTNNANEIIESLEHLKIKNK